MRERNGTFRRADERPVSRVAVLVLGTGPFWTQQTCGHIETAFETACLRLESIEGAALIAAELAALRLVIVDQIYAEDLLARPERYFGIRPPATVALAYRRAEIARDIHRRFDHARHGAMGYLPMSAPFEVWLSAIRLLLHRERFLPSDLRDPPPPAPDADPVAAPAPLPDPDRAARSDSIHGLTEREMEVLRLASAGERNKAISHKLGISEHTVKLHMHHVYAKLGVSNRTAAASLLRAVDPPSG